MDRSVTVSALIDDFEIAAMRYSDFDPQPLRVSLEHAQAELLRTKRALIEHVAPLPGEVANLRDNVAYLAKVNTELGLKIIDLIELRDAVVAMDAAFRRVDNGEITQATEFEVDNAWERVRALLLVTK
jgi:hypothetical protein